MSETNDTDDETKPSSGTPVTLSLKRTVDAGHVRQNFGHGRSKSVLVEKKKRRTILAPSKETASPAPVAKVAPAAPAAAVTRTAPAATKDGSVSRTLSDQEKEARLKALTAARAREAVEKQRAEEEAVRAAELAAQNKVEAEARAKQEAEEAAKRAAEEGDKAGQEGSVEPAAATSGQRQAAANAVDPAIDAAPSESAKPGRKIETKIKKPKVDRTPVKRATDRRPRGRLTITNALNEGQRERSLASLRRKREREKSKSAGAQLPREKISREVVIPEVITIQELANRMAERAVDVIKYLMQQGDMHKINDVLDADSAQLIAEEFGHSVKRVSEADVEEGLIVNDDADEGVQLPRAPVVTIMGHVDHGKTSLLDAIRHENVVAGEAGGITQHIGAYQVKTDDGNLITFIDTPGHAAFTAMRARGAKVTDLVILVVAADDGVMPQTIEAINHAKAANVPLIVAINKMDKPSADPTKVRTDLLQHEIVVESMSGDVLDVEVSALAKTGLDDLLEAISMQAEILELQANPDRNAEGIVVEAKLERGRGPVGTLLVQRGTLKVGQIVVAGTAWGRVRALINDHGDHVAEAGPSVPVEMLGFNGAPDAGDQFAIVENEARAREITEYRERKRRDLLSGGAGSGRTLEQMMSQLKDGGKQEFPLVIKGDVQGSVEAISGALDKLGTDEVGARLVHTGVGGVTESDVALAQASGAVVVAFNVRASQQANDAAIRQGVEIRQYAIIYDVIDDVKSAMSGMLAPLVREHFLGNARILEIFNISKVGKIAGCQVTDGKVQRGASVRLIRDNVVIHEGKLSTLKRFKDEVKEVQVGQECGMAFEKYQDMRAEDVIECFQTEEIERTL